jgi:hypothetical protein
VSTFHPEARDSGRARPCRCSDGFLCSYLRCVASLAPPQARTARTEPFYWHPLGSGFGEKRQERAGGAPEGRERAGAAVRGVYQDVMSPDSRFRPEQRRYGVKQHEPNLNPHSGRPNEVREATLLQERGSSAAMEQVCTMSHPAR